MSNQVVNPPIDARSILLEVLNDMLWAVDFESQESGKRLAARFQSHLVTPFSWFLKQNPKAAHEAIAALEGLIDQLEIQANEQPNG